MRLRALACSVCWPQLCVHNQPLLTITLHSGQLPGENIDSFPELLDALELGVSIHFSPYFRAHVQAGAGLGCEDRQEMGPIRGVDSIFFPQTVTFL